jgi:gamma-glutamylcyclotransferase (GGCT)/AIG2-like uncharacterized protein YtfP
MLAAVKKLVYGDPAWGEAYKEATFRNFFKSVNKAGMYTPDMWQLQQKVNHHVFLYGDTMEGHRNHYKYISNSPFLGIAYTVPHSFIMWKKAIGEESFPLVLQGVSHPAVKPNRVRGELYDLSPQQVIKLDEYMLNTVQFNRVRLKVVVPHTRIVRFDPEHGESRLVETKGIYPPVECWMYVGRTDYWEDLLDGGFHYPVVKTKEINREFKVFNNSFHYSVAEHNDFKVTSKRTVP